MTKRASRKTAANVVETPIVETPPLTVTTDSTEFDISKATSTEFDAEIAAVLAARKAKAEAKAAAAATSKASKVSTQPSVRAPRAKADKPEPGSKVEKAMQLAARSCGVTPDELSEQIVWKGAPWKWLFHNPKGNGWCQRFGYDFRSEKDGGSVVYYVTKKAEALTEAAA